MAIYQTIYSSVFLRPLRSLTPLQTSSEHGDARCGGKIITYAAGIPRTSRASIRVASFPLFVATNIFKVGEISSHIKSPWWSLAYVKTSDCLEADISKRDRFPLLHLFVSQFDDLCCLRLCSVFHILESERWLVDKQLYRFGSLFWVCTAFDDDGAHSNRLIELRRAASMVNASTTVWITII